MPQQSRLSRWLRFVGDAKNRPNVKGPMFEEMVHFWDHFTDDTLSQDKWLVTVSNGTIAVDHTYPGGWALFTTASSQDGEVSYLSTPLAWQDDMSAICEARILFPDVSAGAIYFGFADARFQTSPAMAIDYDGGTLIADSTDAVGFIIDADDIVNGVSSIVGVSVNNGGTPQAVDTSVDWKDGKIHTLRVKLNPDGDATFYLDQEIVRNIQSAVASGSMMCITIEVANRTNAAQAVKVDRVDGWQDLYTV